MKLGPITITLIPDWKLSWKRSSMWGCAGLAVTALVDQAPYLLSLLLDAQQTVLPIAQPLIPARWWPWISLGFAVAIALLRNIQQQSLHKETGQQS